MKITLSIEGCKPVDVELDPMPLHRVSKRGEPCALPAPKFKKGDWFVDPDDAGWTIEIAGPGEWMSYGEYAYGVADHLGGGETMPDIWLESSLADPDTWLPIPPKPTNLPAGKVLTGEVRVPKDGDGFAGLGGGAMYTVGKEGVTGAGGKNMQFLGGRRWIVTDAPVAQPSPRYKKGDWFVDPKDARWTTTLTGDGEWSGIKYDYPAISAYQSGSVETRWAESCLSDTYYWLPIPPRLDKAPEGYEFTGEVRVPNEGDIYVCDANRVGLVRTRGVDDISAQREAWWCEGSMQFFGGRRWILRKAEPAKPTPRLGFRVWQEGIKDDGRVMLRLVDSRITDGAVIVEAVNASGEALQTPNIVVLSAKGIARCGATLLDEPDILIPRDGDRIALNE